MSSLDLYASHTAISSDRRSLQESMSNSGKVGFEDRNRIAAVVSTQFTQITFPSNADLLM